MTRAELDAEWKVWRERVFEEGFDGQAQREHGVLLGAEREVVDHAAQARAIRWAAEQESDTMHAYGEAASRLRALSDYVESGALEVPQ